jgi:hypothetical protein
MPSSLPLYFVFVLTDPKRCISRLDQIKNDTSEYSTSITLHICIHVHVSQLARFIETRHLPSHFVRCRIGKVPLTGFQDVSHFHLWHTDETMQRRSTHALCDSLESSSRQSLHIAMPSVNYVK